MARDERETSLSLRLERRRGDDHEWRLSWTTVSDGVRISSGESTAPSLDQLRPTLRSVLDHHRAIATSPEEAA